MGAANGTASETASAPVAVLAPAGRDGAVTAMVLGRAGFVAHVCDDMAALCAAVAGRGPSGVGVTDDVGVLLVAEEALAGTARETLLTTLAAQPAWSDVPVVVLTGEGELSGALSPALDAVTAHANVTLIERPVRVATLVTALRSALRARRRQFDVRDHLAERAAAAVALDTARAQAEEANRAKATFLAVMSHELRTPLNAIGGYAQLLDMGLHGPVTDAQHAALGRVQRAQAHLLGLINDVLNYAKLESGRVDYALGVVDVREVVAEVVPLVEPQFAAKGLTLTVHLPDTPCEVWADRDKLGQVLVNLLSNAMKFTDARHELTGAPGGVTVDIATRTGVSSPSDDGGGDDGAADSIFLRVSDTGRGIPGEKQEMIFEPFVQVRTGYAHATDGTGLGLAISRDLARGMGGDLRVRSVAGEGATFTVALRRVTPNEHVENGRSPRST